MLKADRFNQRKYIQDEASQWLSKIEHELNSFEKQSLVAWLNQDKQHYLSFVQLSNNHPILSQLTGIFPVKQSKIPATKTKIVLTISLALLFFIAVISIMNALSIVNVPFFPSNGHYKKEYFTGVGQQKSIELNDGSVLILNTDTLVEIDFTKDYRRLSLLKGEAQFTVAKDKTRPFTVFVGENSFTALGTIFNIQKKSALNTELVVTEGTVLVTEKEQFLNHTESAITSFSTLELPSLLQGTILTSGEKTNITKIKNNKEQSVKNTVEKVALDQIQKDLAWQQGMLIFNGEPLEDVLAEVARYQTIHFEITEQKLKHLKVAGYFKTGDLTPLLTSLHYNFDISHEIVDDTILLSSKNNLR